MSESFLGEIRIFAGTFAPLGWALCNGQLLPISENDALYTLLGTTYGGDGQVTFGVPDLRSRIPIHTNSTYPLGAMGGVESVTLTTANLPAHSHTMRCSSVTGTAGGPKDGFLAACSSAGGAPVDTLYEATADSTLASSSITAVGGSQPHNNIQPFLVVNFIIATQGIFPPQS